ncbi:hypothetical protein SY27_05755 [Flavobacterium sp. 316]|uniref:Uncharacterized protein n=1 Tax=Flavobacterium sediminilitoris TaxID=2024526 RepID=A0ABY4HIY0_9FLAO|nr:MULTISPECIES: hypothetical protein [Flavobacterium]KIX22162.1 hypothetical protein SY27_05755 [Flavobacterium sp. 316]UOX32480.1 hypothetical protein LXD69_10500 [Flavobacterium sediminilitoris]
MPNTLINRTKLALEKVSFDPALFSRELLKAIKFLLATELEELAIWFVNFTKGKPELQNVKISANEV